jgi:hypothetical protein
LVFPVQIKIKHFSGKKNIFLTNAASAVFKAMPRQGPKAAEQTKRDGPRGSIFRAAAGRRGAIQGKERF